MTNLGHNIKLVRKIKFFKLEITKELIFIQ